MASRPDVIERLAPLEARPGRRIVKCACPHDCPDTCVMTVAVEDGRAVAIGGDPDHPQLGAQPAIDDVRQKLRAAGVRNLPRPTTRENIFGLTVRQLDILALLAESLTNAEIAARLHLSPKTVDHHVSAVLAKLDVHSREEAVRVAKREGLVKK